MGDEARDKLTKAQREALLKFDGRIWSARELNLQTWAALFNKGILADYRAAGNRFFGWTDFGQRVRTILQEEARERE